MGGHHYRVILSEAGALLIIVRNNRWVEADWLVVVLVAMVAPLRPRTMGRMSSLPGVVSGSGPRIIVLHDPLSFASVIQ